MVGQIGDLRTNLIKFIRDYNATKLENENLTQLVANDEHKRKLEVSLNDCREKMHQFYSENLQKEDTIKDLEYKLSQITNENDEVVKKRDSAIEEIMNQLAIKANEYKTTHEKLVEAQSTAEIFAEKNANLKLDHETKTENFQVEIQKLQRYSFSLFPYIFRIWFKCLQSLSKLVGIRLGKPDLWGLRGESCCIVGSLHYAKMILTLGDHFGIVKT